MDEVQINIFMQATHKIFLVKILYFDEEGC